MSVDQAVLTAFVGRPQTSSNPQVSRRYACEWYWSVYDHDRYECPECGRGIERAKQFDVHHRDGNPTNNHPDNLVGLCRRCHIWHHSDTQTIKGLDVEEWKRAFGRLADADVIFDKGLEGLCHD